MGIFKKRKKDFVDLGEHYKKKQEKLSNLRESSKNQSSREYQDLSSGNQSSRSQEITPFGGFFNAQQNQSTENVSDSVNPDERKRQLSKKLRDITEKLEDLSNQIYHLQNRLEVVERKLDVNRGY